MRLKQLIQQEHGTLSDLFGVPIHLLDANPDNVRIDTPELREHIRTLANSIIAQGFLRSRPLTVRQSGDRLIVVDGNCRLLAVRLAMEEGAEIKNLPCVSEAPGTNDADRTCNMLLANSGMAHTPLEYAAAIKRLMSYGWSDTDVARKLGRSRQWVVNALETAALPADVQAQMVDGVVSATTARKMVKRDGAGAAAKIAAAAAERGGKRVTERHLKPVIEVAPTPYPASDTIAVTGGNGASASVELIGTATPMGGGLSLVSMQDDDAIQDELVALRAAVRGFLAAWDDPNSGHVIETVAALRECVA
jgi:ParB/RepB/Spo0J family partition protein